MSRQKTNPPHFLDSFSFKVPFNVKGNEKLIEKLSSRDVLVRVDSTQQMACACLDNSQDRLKLLAAVV